MDINDFGEKLISMYNKKITNEVFLMIQNDRELMYDYLRLVEEGTLQTVNMAIGKKVKQAYNLKNINEREDNPSCTLIQSHQKFE